MDFLIDQAKIDLFFVHWNLINQINQLMALIALLLDQLIDCLSRLGRQVSSNRSVNRLGWCIFLLLFFDLNEYVVDHRIDY